MTLAEQIKGLPTNGRIYVDAGGRGQIETAITTARLQAMVKALEHYADEKMWYRSHTHDKYDIDAKDVYNVINTNGYDIAREALGDKV